MKKALLIGCPLALLLGVGGIVGLVYVVFWATSGAVDAADEFLALTAQGKYHEAYASTSQTMQSQQDEQSFTAAVQQLGLDEYESAFWNSRHIRDNHASLRGSITTRTGRTLPVSMELLHEQGEWKVLAVNVQTAGTPNTAALDVPPEEELDQLAARSMLDFNQALQMEDFATFFGTVSNIWQQQTTPEELKDAFQPLIDADIDLAEIEQQSPIYTKLPAIDGNGIMVLEGYYPTKPLRFVFDLKYTFEQTGWKLFGIHVQVIEDQAEESGRLE